MTLSEARITTVEAALVELLDQDYSLSVETRVDVHDHKVGAHSITYADKLLVTGPESVPDHLREAITTNKPLFLAAACILNPPTPWLRDLLGRCRTGGALVMTGEGRVECRITPDVLARNIAAFVGLDLIDDAHRLDPVVRIALGILDKEDRDAP